MSIDAQEVIPMQWRSAARTDKGMKRKINEDAMWDGGETKAWVVADGMGGHEAGDVASQMVVQAVSAALLPDALSHRVDVLEDTLIATNQSIRNHSANAFDGRTMGATVVSMVVDQEFGACIWAGDSRLYRLRSGVFTRISSDHSEVQELVDRGVLTEEEADAHPNSNVITRAVGGAPSLFVDVRIFDIQSKDRFVLCSDGLYNEVNDADIISIISLESLDEAADQLIAAALAAGAKDNVTVIVIEAA